MYIELPGAIVKLHTTTDGYYSVNIEASMIVGIEDAQALAIAIDHVADRAQQLNEGVEHRKEAGIIP
ncbi:hypothetical protein CWC39_00765 [Corynebacterium heidelbergense]|uniref:Uncharacterized protein n=2 Tax=Corynebacterium heidelbergense TaxID=2055947 RepID=A0A364VE33_9CORY|nr:hypothetical protein CWC39_00765 [Corynebacterium heidelbergense]